MNLELQNMEGDYYIGPEDSMVTEVEEYFVGAASRHEDDDILEEIRRIDEACLQSKFLELGIEDRAEGHQQSTNDYMDLMETEQLEVIPTTEPFECQICLTEVKEYEGVTLRNCLHKFCSACLADTIKFSEDPEVKCPFMNQYSCQSFLQVILDFFCF